MSDAFGCQKLHAQQVLLGLIFSMLHGIGQVVLNDHSLQDSVRVLKLGVVTELVSEKHDSCGMLKTASFQVLIDQCAALQE